MNNDVPLTKHGRKLVWHDEFTGKTLNPENWHMQRSMFTENRIYDNGEKHIRIENNNLHMQIHRNGDTYSLPQGLSTKNCMNFKYGYLEMRAKIPYRHSAWPSFWLLGNTPFHNPKLNWHAEVDIFEVFSSVNRISPNLHKWGTHGHTMLPGIENSIVRAYNFENYENLNNEYHTYGFLWDEHEMAFLIDDNCYFKSCIDEKSSFVSQNYPTTEGFHEFLYIILNNEMFTESSKWKPDGSAATPEDPMPIDYWVNWIRLYQNSEKEKIHFKADIEKKQLQNEND